MPLILEGYETGHCATCGIRFNISPQGQTRTKGHTRPKQVHVVNGKAEHGPAHLGTDWRKPASWPRLYVWQCSNCNHRQGNQTFRQWEYNLRHGKGKRHQRTIGNYKTFNAIADRLVILMEEFRRLGFTDNDF